MAKNATKKALAKVRTSSLKTKKIIASKSARKPKKPTAKKPARKLVRRSAANVAKLRKSILAGAKAGKTAEMIAAELGISQSYVYTLKNRK